MRKRHSQSSGLRPRGRACRGGGRRCPRRRRRRPLAASAPGQPRRRSAGSRRRRRPTCRPTRPAGITPGQRTMNGHADAAFVEAALAAAERPGLPTPLWLALRMRISSGPLSAREEDERVLRQVQLVERRQQPADLAVEVGRPRRSRRVAALWGTPWRGRGGRRAPAAPSVGFRVACGTRVQAGRRTAGPGSPR